MFKDTYTYNHNRTVEPPVLALPLTSSSLTSPTSFPSSTRPHHLPIFIPPSFLLDCHHRGTVTATVTTTVTVTSLHPRLDPTAHSLLGSAAATKILLPASSHHKRIHPCHLVPSSRFPQTSPLTPHFRARLQFHHLNPIFRLADVASTLDLQKPLDTFLVTFHGTDTGRSTVISPNLLRSAVPQPAESCRTRPATGTRP